ncbi:hypothetical protein SAMN05216489_02310 [Streptomyces sp. 3213]|uniref:hypothetical protein n=1 Tax=Streptomyces sp. 3213.3 TaxID=1855348 RepID=UPI00089D0B4A|nr:hypothetical protein [Streptomyces sp. 3213.3]SED03270.1 hypothetical protein SAMN05216489_02310 [Streptomyces sp. 3213] [Streptomyces sp. 3213.3]
MTDAHFPTGLPAEYASHPEAVALYAGAMTAIHGVHVDTTAAMCFWVPLAPAHYLIGHYWRRLPRP